MSAFVALDFETADYQQDSACSIGIVRVEHGQIVQRVYHLIRPPRQMFKFSYIHGICWKDVANEATFGELWSTISPVIEDAEFIAAHNARFDQGVLYACCDTYGITRPRHEFTCTVKLARRALGIYPTKLSNVCKVLGIPLNHHHALSDAEACGNIVLAASLASK